MACEHTQPADVIRMAEMHLQNKDIIPEQWEGFHFQFRENIDSWGHKSICIEVLRRDGQWVITRLDRLKDPYPNSELGPRILQSPPA